MYDTFKEENVQGANASSKIVVKGTVTQPIGDGINVEAYHAPKFSSNNIPFGLLQKNFEIVFSESIRGYPGCFFMNKGVMSIIDEVKLKDGLYPLILSTINSKSYQGNAAKKKNSVDEWHHKLEHLSPNHLNRLSKMNSTIPVFNQELIKQHHCVPCLVEKRNNSTYELHLERPLDLLNLSTLAYLDLLNHHLKVIATLL